MIIIGIIIPSYLISLVESVCLRSITCTHSRIHTNYTRHGRDRRAWHGMAWHETADTQGGQRVNRLHNIYIIFTVNFYHLKLLILLSSTLGSLHLVRSVWCLVFQISCSKYTRSEYLRFGL